MGEFRKMRVWKAAKKLAVDIYHLTDDESRFARDFKLRDQMRRAAVSIASNIAEGDELDSNKQSIRHFYIAKGSAAELMTQLIISHEINYLEEEIMEEMVDRCQHISSMLFKLIESRKQNDHRKP